MAGDLREIDMTKATNMDGKKIRLVGDDGKGYWMEKEDLASVVGGLLPVADASKNGLMSMEFYKSRFSYIPPTNSGKFTHLFNLKQYAQGCFYLKFGNTTNDYNSICIIDLNNRSQGNISVSLSKIVINEKISPNLYAKRQSNNSIDVFVKQEVANYTVLRFAWIHSPEEWYWTYVGTESDVSESELTKIL